MSEPPDNTPADGGAGDQERPASSNITHATYHGPFKFIQNNGKLDDAEIKAQYPATHPIWHKNKDDDFNRSLPAPSWFTSCFGPLPYEKNAFVEPWAWFKSGKEDYLQNEPELKRRFFDECKNKSGQVIGSRLANNHKYNRIPDKLLVPYLGFPSGGALTSFVFTEGLELLGSYKQHLFDVGAKNKIFRLDNIAAVISQLETTDPYMNGIMHSIRANKDYIPVVLNAKLKSVRLQEKTPAKGVATPATGMAFVYRLLCWMSHGDNWDADRARNDWIKFEDGDGVRLEQKLSAYGADLNGKYRFRQHHDSDPLSPQLYFGFTLEDWYRALLLMAHVVIETYKPWEKLGPKIGKPVLYLHFLNGDEAKDQAQESNQDQAQESNEDQAQEYQDTAKKDNGDRQKLFEAYQQLNSTGKSPTAADRAFSNFVDDVIAGRQGADSRTFEHEQPATEMAKALKAFNFYSRIVDNPHITGNCNVPSSYKIVDLHSVTSA